MTLTEAIAKVQNFRDRYKEWAEKDDTDENVQAINVVLEHIANEAIVQRFNDTTKAIERKICQDNERNHLPCSICGKGMDKPSPQSKCHCGQRWDNHNPDKCMSERINKKRGKK